MNYRVWLTRARKWLTRAYRYEFEVVQPFTAVATISGAQRQFKQGETVYCDTEPDGPTILFRWESNFFRVERAVFEACCRARKPTTMPC